MEDVDQVGTRVQCSVVIPVFNETEVLAMLVTRVVGVLETLSSSWELLFVDDGSSDDSLAQLRQFHEQDPRINIITFSRNFGHQAAITAGLDYAAGEAVIIMDADLQDPPEVIPELVAKWREGYEVVYAVRAQREGETWFKRWTAAVFYRLIHRTTDVAIPLDVGDFRLIGRRALEPLRMMRESHRFVRGMVSWIGFPQTGVSYTRAPRLAGETKYPLRKMLKLALEGITGFSAAPLRMISSAGLLVIGIGCCVLFYSLAHQLFDGRPLSLRSDQILAAQLILGGGQLVLCGILATYLGYIYDEVRRRPLYIIAEMIGITPRRAVSTHEVEPHA